MAYLVKDGKFSEGGDFDFDWEAIQMNSSTHLVFQGKDDYWVPLESGIELASNIGSGTIQHIKGSAGHFTTISGYADFPDLVSAVKNIN